jgi:hypothetical protein
VTLLQEILNNQETSAPTRAAVQKTFNHACKLQQARIARDHHHAPPHGIRAGIIPPQIFQAVRDSEASSSEQKEHAEKNLEYTKKIHSARVADHGTAAETSDLYRELYTSAKTDTINKTLLFEEGADVAIVSKDQNASEVYDFFGKTYKFYYEVNNSRFLAASLFLGTKDFTRNEIFENPSVKKSRERVAPKAH